jgi:hypothetical protein
MIPLSGIPLSGLHCISNSGLHERDNINQMITLIMITVRSANEYNYYSIKFDFKNIVGAA